MILGVNGRFLATRQTGVQRWAYEVVGRLLQHGDVALFLPRDAVLPPLWDARVHRGRLRGHAWEQLELRRTARRRCDVLFNPSNSAPRRAECQTVMLHDVLPLDHPEWYSRSFALWYRMLIPRVARNADAVLTSSQHAAQTIAATTRVSIDRIAVVPQGLAPFDRPAAHADTDRARTRFGISGPYVLALGDGDPRKNVAFAVEVVHRYRLRYGTAPTLVVAGEANRHVHGTGARVELAHGIRVGHVADDVLRALYTGAAALLYPSFDEGFGRPPLEALCCATPVLAADYEAAAETLRDTPARRLPLDATAWVLALHDVLHGERPDAQLREQLNARWSWDAAAAAVLAACRAAAERSTRKAS